MVVLILLLKLGFGPLKKFVLDGPTLWVGPIGGFPLQPRDGLSDLSGAARLIGSRNLPNSILKYLTLTLVFGICLPCVLIDERWWLCLRWANQTVFHSLTLISSFEVTSFFRVGVLGCACVQVLRT